MSPEHRPAPDSHLSAAECYNVLRDQLHHEDNLITQRLSWLMGSQAFLFTAYAIVLNGPERPKNALIGSLQDYLLGTLPAVGLLSAALIYVSIIAGVLAMFNIHQLARKLCDGTAAGFPLFEDESSSGIWDSHHRSFCRRFLSLSGFCFGAAGYPPSPIRDRPARRIAVANSLSMAY